MKVVKPKRQPAPSFLEKKSKKISKKKVVEKVPAPPVEDSAVELPSVDTDPALKQIAKETQEVEKQELAEDASEVQEPEVKEPEVKEPEVQEPEVREKVKVKRKDSLIKKKGGADESNYLSISNPSEDDKKIKVPSYSYKKNRGILYISHVPHGFFEKQMGDFFNQFGTVTNLRLARSSKTGQSSGYAFIEFKYSEVAKVVSETMNNYLMFNKIMKCEMLPKERMSQAVFMNKINPSKPPGLLRRRASKKLLNSVKSVAEDEKRIKKQLSKLSKKQKQLAAAGIDYTVEVS